MLIKHPLGLAFHPTQPLLAAALHNGSVQLWNYRMGVLVDRFEEHEGTSIDEVKEDNLLTLLRRTCSWRSFSPKSRIACNWRR